MKDKSSTHSKENRNYTFLQLEHGGNKYRNFNQVEYSKANVSKRQYYQNQNDDRYQKHIKEITNNNYMKTPQKYTKRSHINSYNETDDYSLFNQRGNTQNVTLYEGTQEKKYKAKDQYMQTKLSNISSYQHKIQSLLQIVNKSPFSGKKQIQIIEKPTKYHQNKNPSNFNINHHQNQAKNQTKSKKAPELLQKKSQRHLQINQNCNNVFINPNEPNEKSHKKKHRRQMSKEQEQYTRKKSKQYMKSIQKQVKQITKTVGLLNQKINKNDKIVFKKQINFDDLDDLYQKQDINAHINANGNVNAISSHKKRQHYSKFYENSQKKKNHQHQISCSQFDDNSKYQNKGNLKSIQFSYEEYKERKKNQRNQEERLAKTPTKKSYYEYQNQYLNAENPLTPSKKAGQIYKQDHRQRS